MRCSDRVPAHGSCSICSAASRVAQEPARGLELLGGTWSTEAGESRRVCSWQPRAAATWTPSSPSFEGHDRQLRAIAWRLLGERSLMDDALQEVAIKAARALPELRDDAALAAWLRRTTYRTCLDLLRRDGEAGRARAGGHARGPGRGRRPGRRRRRPATWSRGSSRPSRRSSARRSCWSTRKVSTTRRRPSCSASLRAPSPRGSRRPARSSGGNWRRRWGGRDDHGRDPRPRDRPAPLRRLRRRARGRLLGRASRGSGARARGARAEGIGGPRPRRRRLLRMGACRGGGRGGGRGRLRRPARLARHGRCDGRRHARLDEPRLQSHPDRPAARRRRPRSTLARLPFAGLFLPGVDRGPGGGARAQDDHRPHPQHQRRLPREPGHGGSHRARHLPR